MAEITLEDLKQCAKAALMKQGRAETILGEVRDVASAWPGYAAKARVPTRWREQIGRTLRLGPI